MPRLIPTAILDLQVFYKQHIHTKKNKKKIITTFGIKVMKVMMITDVNGILNIIILSFDPFGCSFWRYSSHFKDYLV